MEKSSQVGPSGATQSSDRMTGTLPLFMVSNKQTDAGQFPPEQRTNLLLINSSVYNSFCSSE